MDPELREYWKLLVPVMGRILNKDHEARYKKTKELYEISTIHVKYLLALRDKEYTLKDLSECLSMDKANTTRAISYLESKGYVKDDREAENSRKFTLSLTDSGRNVADYLNSDIDQMFSLYFKGISDQDLRIIVRSMERTCMNIDSDGTCEKIIESLKKTAKYVCSDERS